MHGDYASTSSSAPHHYRSESVSKRRNLIRAHDPNWNADGSRGVGGGGGAHDDATTTHWQQGGQHHPHHAHHASSAVMSGFVGGAAPSAVDLGTFSHETSSSSAWGRELPVDPGHYRIQRTGVGAGAGAYGAPPPPRRAGYPPSSHASRPSAASSSSAPAPRQAGGGGFAGGTMGVDKVRGFDSDDDDDDANYVDLYPLPDTRGGAGRPVYGSNPYAPGADIKGYYGGGRHEDVAQRPRPPGEGGPKATAALGGGVTAMASAGSGKTTHPNSTAASMSPSSSASRQRRTLSLLRSWVPQSWLARSFVLLTLAEACIDVSIEAVLLSRYHSSYGSLRPAVISDPNDGGVRATSVLPVFVMVFCFAHVYQLVMAVDAVVNRNTVIVVGLLAFNLCFLVYAVIQISEIRAVLGDGVASGTSQVVPVQVLTGSIPAVIGACTLAYVPMSWMLWKQFGWLHFKSLGADRVLKRANMQYQVFVALLKFDFFVFIAFCLQLVLAVLQSNDAERWLTVLAAPFSLCILTFAWFSVRRELRWGMLLFMVGLAGAAAYFVYKLLRIYQDEESAYQQAQKSLTVFSVLALGLLFATAVQSVRCMRNFGKGLRAAFDRASHERKLLRRAGYGHGGAGHAKTYSHPLSPVYPAAATGGATKSGKGGVATTTTTTGGGLAGGKAEYGGSSFGSSGGGGGVALELGQYHHHHDAAAAERHATGGEPWSSNGVATTTTATMARPGVRGVDGEGGGGDVGLGRKKSSEWAKKAGGFFLGGGGGGAGGGSGVGGDAGTTRAGGALAAGDDRSRDDDYDDEAVAARNVDGMSPPMRSSSTLALLKPRLSLD